MLDAVFLDDQAMNDWLAKRDQFSELFSSEFTAYKQAIGPAHGSDEFSRLDQLLRELDVKEKEIIVLAQTGQPGEATKQLADVQDISHAVDEAINTLSSTQLARMGTESEQIAIIYQSDSRWIGIAAAFGLILAIIKGFWLTQVADQTGEKLEGGPQIRNDASHTKGDFLANTSHKIGTPLNGIIGFNDKLSTEKEFFEGAKNSHNSLPVTIAKLRPERTSRVARGQ